jgi:hypothetical protein
MDPEHPDNVHPLFPGLLRPFGTARNAEVAEPDPPLEPGPWSGELPDRPVVALDEDLAPGGAKAASQDDRLPDDTYEPDSHGSNDRRAVSRLKIAERSRKRAGLTKAAAVLLALGIGIAAFGARLVPGSSPHRAKAPVTRAAVMPAAGDQPRPAAAILAPAERLSHPKRSATRHHQPPHRRPRRPRRTSPGTVVATHYTPQTSSPASTPTITRSTDTASSSSQPEQPTPTPVQAPSTQPVQGPPGAPGSPSSGSSNATPSHSSNTNKTPAFGPSGALGPGSSRDG